MIDALNLQPAWSKNRLSSQMYCRYNRPAVVWILFAFLKIAMTNFNIPIVFIYVFFCRMDFIDVTSNFVKYSACLK
jgi:hypothetical protein